MIFKDLHFYILIIYWKILIRFISIKVSKLIDVIIIFCNFIRLFGAFIFPQEKFRSLKASSKELKHYAHRNRVRTIVVESILARSRDSRRAWHGGRRFWPSGDRSHPRDAS